jgi:hypothetical protein
LESYGDAMLPVRLRISVGNFLMPYFRVTLRYRCPRRHGNIVERFYEEEDQEAVSKRMRRDKLICYGCDPPKRINPPTRVPLSSESVPLGFPEFPELPHDVRFGCDHSWKVVIRKGPKAR